MIDDGDELLQVAGVLAAMKLTGAVVSIITTVNISQVQIGVRQHSKSSICTSMCKYYYCGAFHKFNFFHKSDHKSNWMRIKSNFPIWSPVNLPLNLVQFSFHSV